ncbi:MAG: radical SAM protein, partial [Chloroflexi bacterium]|nr:radical SAM protein [Chloroflexota bacterium]
MYADRPIIAPALPKCLYIEVTNRCNSLCETCPRTFITREPLCDITWENFTRVVDSNPAMDRAVLHGIGEPLMHKDLIRMIEYLKARGVYVLFNTNAVLLNRPMQERLIASGLDELRISLDGATPETYLKIRGIPALDKVLQLSAEMVATKRELGAPNPKLSFFFTGMKANLPELPEVIRIAARIGMPEVYLQRLTFFDDGMATADQALFTAYGADQREQEIIAECERLANEHGIIFNGSGATTARKSLEQSLDKPKHPWQRCMRPWTVGYVTANGNALPCCIAPFTGAPYRGMILGNAFGEGGFASVYNGPQYLKFREQFLGDTPPASCAGCGS